MLPDGKVIALLSEFNVSLQPSSCMCAWVASFWTTNHKRLIAKGKTPALAVEALMALVGPGDKPICRTSK